MAIKRVKVQEGRGFYTPAEVATMLECSKSTVRRWIHNGDLGCHKFGSRTYRISFKDFDTFIRRMKLS